jgi:hypothetical protein
VLILPWRGKITPRTAWWLFWRRLLTGRRRPRWCPPDCSEGDPHSIPDAALPTSSAGGKRAIYGHRTCRRRSPVTRAEHSGRGRTRADADRHVRIRTGAARLRGASPASIAAGGLAGRQGPNIVAQPNLLAALRRRELDAVSARLSAESAARSSPAPMLVPHTDLSVGSP